jgi:hypothetical protein
MKAKHSVWKSKLAKTMFLTTVVLVAALFMGSAASAALKAVGTGEKKTQDNSNICSILGLPAGTLNVPNVQPTLSAQKTTGRAPISASVGKQTATLGGRGMFYAYDLYTYNTCTFDQDAVVNNLAYAGIYFFSGGDCDPDGNWYAVGYSGGLYSIDKDTGAYTYIAYTVPLNSLVYDSTSGIWYCSGYDTSYIDSLFTIDITTGTTTFIGHFSSTTNIMISLMCDTYGNMYSYDVLFGGTSHIYSIDKSTGYATQGPDMGHDFCYAQEGKFDRNYGDNTLYLAAYDYGQGQSYLATCDVETGTVTMLNLFSPMDEIDALAIPYILTVYDNDVGVKKIIAPVSGDAGIVSPQVTVKNFGNNEEFFPTEVTISKKVYSTYLTQDFEGSFPPAGWTVQTIIGGDWHRNDFWSTPRPNGAGTGYCADADVNMEGSPPMITLLTSPSMDLSAAPGAILNVDSFEYVYYYDILLIDVSIDGGTSWNNIYKVGSMYEYGTLHHIEKDMSAYAGNSDVRLRFGYIAEQADMYWQIDNVMVRSYNWNTEYDQVVYTDLMSMQSTNLTFPAWTPADMGVSENVNIEYKCDAQTMLSGDQQTQNDMKEKLFTLHYGYFHNVAITDIPSPVSGLAQTEPVSVTLANHGQNAETVKVGVTIGKIANPTVIYSEDFSTVTPPGLPTGWGTDSSANWYTTYSNNAGGVAPELEFNYYPVFTGTSRCYTGPIDTSAYPALQLSFKQYVNHFATPYTLMVQTSTNGVDWNTVYTQDGGPYGPATTTVGLTGGSPTLQVAFVFSGYSYNINYWFIDDVQIQSLPMVEEYNQSVMTSINPGEVQTVNLPDWTPADLPLGSIDYVVTATATLNGVNVIGTYGFEDWVPEIPPTPPTPPTFPPEGWAAYDVDGGGSSWGNWEWYDSAYYAHSGEGSAMCWYDYMVMPNDDWLATNGIVVAPGGSFSFWYRGYFDGSYDSFEVYLSTTGNTVADFQSGTMIYSNVNPSPIYSQFTYDASAYAGQTVWFAIRYTGFYAYALNVDDMVLPDGTTQGFEPTPGSPGVPGYFPDWTSYQIVGTDTYNQWVGSSYSSYPPYMSPHSGTYMAWYNSYLAGTNDQARLQSDDPTDLSALGYDQYQGSLWMYHDFGYSGNADNVQVQVYDVNNPGMGWQNVGGAINRYDGVNNGWVQHFFDLTPWKDTSVNFGFLATSQFGNAMAIDDIALAGLGALPDGYPADNILSKMITLSFEHDVGIDSILAPAKEQAKDLIWDNGPHIASALSSQFAASYPFNSQVADDFQFDKTMDVQQVAFDGAFWNGASVNPIDLNVIFYADDGSGNQPTGAGMDDPTSTALQVELHTGVMGTDNGDGTFNYNIVLNAPFVANAGVKYWYVSQWVGDFPPQWGTCPSSTQQLHVCDQGFPVLGTPYWTPMTAYGDVAFQLMGAEHHGGGGLYVPGTYSLKAIVKNFGVTFTESNIPVEAKITHTDNNTVIYDQTGVFAGPIGPGASGTITFPEFTLANYTAWEGKYKIEVWTSMPGDDHPSNDKKSITIEMAIPDVLPPITTQTMTGTMGLNGWYVSNVVITLTATDPFPPMKYDPKPPSGVNYTMYKLHTGDTYTVYTAPVTVSTDGQYQLYYYSVDKAGNVEVANGPVNFKVDKTAPVFNSFNATAENAQKTKWLIVADLSDPASGVNHVEFYVDDQLVGTVNATPWEFHYQGKGKMAQAIAYDNAGNSAMSLQIQDLSLILSSQSVQSLNGMLSVQQNLQLK